MSTSSCINEILVRGLDDWIQAAEVASIARTHGGAKGDDETRKISIEIVRELLNRDLIQIGEVSSTGFQSWNLSEVDVLAKIDADWRRRPHGPDLGELFWLNLTEYGQRIANETWERADSGGA